MRMRISLVVLWLDVELVAKRKLYADQVKL